MLVQPSLYCCSILILFNLKNLRHHQSYIFLFTDLIPARRRRSTSNSFKGHTALAMQLSKILRQKQKDDHRVQKFLSQTKPGSESEQKDWQKCDRNEFLILIICFRHGRGVPGWLGETSATKHGRKLPRPARWGSWDIFGVQTDQNFVMK